MSDDTTHKNIEAEFHTTIEEATSTLGTLMNETNNSNAEVKRLILDISNLLVPFKNCVKQIEEARKFFDNF